MLLILAVTLVPPIVIGSLVARTFLPVNRQAGAAWLLNLSLGAGLGVGVLSLLYFFVRLLVGPSSLIYSVAEILTLAAAAAGCWFFRDKTSSGAEPRAFGGWQWLLFAATIVCLILAEAQFLDSSASAPYGNWDAWSIWNLRAKLLAQPDGSWKNAFSPLLNQLAGGGATHGDYPLLLSGYIARCWSLKGSIGDVTVPIAVAGLFSLATVGLLAGGLAVLRGWTAALISGLVLLGTAEFLHNSTWQFSDVPLGFFYLAVFVLVFLVDETRGNGRVAVVAGLALGCAAWTKDEGILFTPMAITAFLAYLFFARIERPIRVIAQFAAGAVVPLVTVVCFKAFLAPHGASWGPLTVSVALANMGKPWRYLRILQWMWQQLLRLGIGVANPAVSLAVLAACLGVPRERVRRPVVFLSFAALAAIFGGYCLIYLTTPYDIEWQLGTSSGRLLMQLVPSAIFVTIATCRTAEETATTTEEPQIATRVRRKKPRKAQTARPVR
jgi:hypothetical protein